MQAMNNYQVPGVSQFDRDVYTDVNGLKDINKLADKDQKAALKKMAQQFEGLFIQMMLKTMREANSVFADEKSSEMDFHQSMFDNQLALTMSSSRGIGLADSFYQQMVARYSEEGGENKVASRLNERLDNVKYTQLPVKKIDAVPNTPEEFVDKLYPQAARVADALGVDPTVIIAQSALETGWGKHVINDKYGRSSFNLFNIKADGRWSGDSVNVQTLEYRDGVAVKEQANFRRYQNIEDSFTDYARLILTEPRYHSARQANSSEEFIDALQDAGYATDPAYANKVKALLDQDVIRKHQRNNGIE